MTLEKELAAVEKAATHAVDLVQTFADQDPEDPTTCWQNPSRMYEQLDQARSQALEAWKMLEQAKELYLQALELLDNLKSLTPDGTLIQVYLASCNNLAEVLSKLDKV